VTVEDPSALVFVVTAVVEFKRIRQREKEKEKKREKKRGKLV